MRWCTVRRLAELRLLAIIAAVLIAAALLGRVMAPKGRSADTRLSSRLQTPHGASAFRAALTRFGVPITEQRRPFFALDSADAARTGAMIAVLEPTAYPTLPERRALRDWVARGGRLLLAGSTGVSSCFGWHRVSTDSVARRQAGQAFEPDDGTMKNQVPLPGAILRRDTVMSGNVVRRCEPYHGTVARRLWITGNEPSAVLLRFPSGGEVILVADASIFSNHVLRYTAAGPMVMEWVLANPPRALIIDEYHHGFGRAGSLPGAVLARTWRSPAGWMVIQAAAAGLLLLLLGAVRFGPAIPAVERRRRTPLEHLDALAAGLERGGAAGTAVRLIIGGLRRRLGGLAARARGQDAWLESLGDSSRSDASRAAVGRLRGIAGQAATNDDVLHAANAVEDVWENLKGPAHSRS